MNVKEKGKNNNRAEKEARNKKGSFSMQAAKTDPNGSWTGVPAEPHEKPVQNADDL